VLALWKVGVGNLELRRKLLGGRQTVRPREIGHHDINTIAELAGLRRVANESPRAVAGLDKLLHQFAPDRTGRPTTRIGWAFMICLPPRGCDVGGAQDATGRFCSSQSA